MRFAAIVNIKAGALRGVDIPGFADHVTASFARHGHEIDVRLTHGAQVSDALDAAFRDRHIEGVIAVGGDGTISSAAALAVASGKVLGVMPGGTMNLVARSHGVPLDLFAAAEALAAGTVIAADAGEANGQVFVHQYSVGLHSRLVSLRETRAYGSRLGKIGASIMAALDAVRRPPRFAVRIAVDGAPATTERLAAVAVSNNRYGAGHLPYPDRVDGGELGLYRVRPLSAAAATRLMADLMLGNWPTNPDMAASTCKTVRLSFTGLQRRHRAVIDGELAPLEPEVEIRMRPGALRLLLPNR